MCARVKGQHFVPRAACLEHFAHYSHSKSLLWVYPVSEAGEILLAEEKEIPPRQLCKETSIYESPNRPVNEIEKGLESIEREYNELLRTKIMADEKLTPKEKDKVALFISTLEARTPVARDSIFGSLDELGELSEKVERQHAPAKEPKARLKLEQAKSMTFTENLAIAAHINRWRFADFLFLKISALDHEVGGFFITSDRPVTSYDFGFMNSGSYGIPPSSKSMELVVPLTPSIALLANHRGLEGFKNVTPNFIKEINNRSLLFAGRFVISLYQLDEEIVNPILERHRQSLLLKFME